MASFFTLCMYHAHAQSVSGFVMDAETGEVLPGVTIRNQFVVDSTEEDISFAARNAEIISTTDMDGYFSMQIKPGLQLLVFSFIGYESMLVPLNGDTLSAQLLQIRLMSNMSEMDPVVISGSLYEKRLSEESVSMVVVSQRIIEQTNATSLSDVLLKAPGVYMMDEQANIRGGTGFTYGAGSRVMLVVDDQILLAADRGDAKWNFVPLELVQQVEVIKGASSVLYGSSALNGVIAVRTAWPTAKPQTTIQVYHTRIDKPSLAEATWWDHAPTQSGIQFSHLQKFDKMDLVLGGNVQEHASHLLGQYSSRARMTWKTRFHPEQANGISWGVNGNLMSDREGLFFLWEDADSGGYKPFQGYLDTVSSTLLNWQYAWLTIDPWLNYFDDKGNMHYFKMRYYGSDVIYSDSTDGDAWLLNLDYQYKRSFSRGGVFTAGAQGYYFDVDDYDVGQHAGISAGVFAQIEKEIWHRLNLNLGVREEFYKLDTTAGAAVPIFKTGLNYAAGRLTNIRLSFGQGYRFPSLVERFANSKLGALSIFPNPDLLPEYGWNTELGVMRNIRRDNFYGYVDVAVYLTEYFDMTEFTFNFYPGLGPGFKSLNNSRARIGGLEVTLKGESEVFGNTLSWLGGYNYIYPANITGDSSNLDMATFAGNFLEGFSASSSDSSFLASVLTYRFRHMARMNMQYEMKRWSFGFDVNYYSLMENLDAIYISFIPGIVEYREGHMQGDWIVDGRVGYKLTDDMQLRFLVKNVSNRMYALRPAKYDPPRSFTLQWSVNL